MRRLSLCLGVVLLLAASAGEAHALTTTDPHLNSSSWQLAGPGFPAAWDFSAGSPETVVAVLDNGFAPHADSGPQVPGWDFVDNDADPTDHVYHGTAVAGIINAIPNNGIGVTGACPSCRVMPVRVLNAAGTGSWLHVADGITWAADHGADVINMSLSSNRAGPAVAEAVAYAIAHDVVVVASAGNEDLAEVGLPAGYPGVLSVGGIDQQHLRYTLAGTQGRWGSNYGPQVALAAPGCSVTTSFGGLYANFCGTSVAGPFVAALAGLMRSYVPGASATAVADAIRATAIPHPDFGLGRIDAAAAMRALGGSPVRVVPKPPTAPKPPAAPAPPPAREVAPKLDLGLRTDKGRVQPGGLVTFTLTVTSPVDTGRALATIAFPHALELISLGGSGCAGIQHVSCELSKLRAGKPFRLVVVTRLRGNGPVSVRATASTVAGAVEGSSRRLVLYGR
jgi:hypothetical protein